MSSEDLTCETCNNVFKNKAGLSNHKRYCKLTIFKCEWCEKEFKENVYLRKHYSLCKSKKSDNKYIDKIHEVEKKLAEREEEFKREIETMENKIARREEEFKRELETMENKIARREEEFKREIESLENKWSNKMKDQEAEFKNILNEKNSDIKNFKSQVDLLIKNPRIVNKNTTKNTTNNNINNILVITDEKLKSFGEPLFENVLPNLEAFAKVCAKELKDHVTITDHSRYMIEYNKDSERIKDKGAFQLSSDIFDAVEPEAKKLFDITQNGESAKDLARQVVNKKSKDVDEFGKHLINYCSKFKRSTKLKNIEKFKAALKDKFETFGIVALHYDASATAGYIIQELHQFFRNVANERYREVLSDDDKTYIKINGQQLLSILKEILVSEEKSLKYHTSNVKSSKKYDEIVELFNRFLNYENDQELQLLFHNQWTME
jgi:hypothetical protein